MLRNIFIPLLFLGVFSNEIAASSMIKIPEGDFEMGNLESQPSNIVFLETFYIEQNEVTNEEFSNKFPEHSYPAGGEKHPATNITWQKAKEYCRSSGGQLPTEEQWEKAARGTDGRIYPWGNKVPRKRPHPFISGVIKRKAGTVRHDYSPYGLYGMAGSVWEWTESNHENKKVVRGGLWNLHLDFYFSKTFDRNFISPEEKHIFLGFRCVRSKK
ncbi:MAG: formylglycine-generating enzyme family protein [Nitrospinales bacterium]